MELKEKTRYSDTELQEFKMLIESKLSDAYQDLHYFNDQIKRLTEEPESRVINIEDGLVASEKEYLNKMAQRQLQYIKHLENALIRIQNKVYGICRVTGKLIPKERLYAVPHATLSIEAKRDQNSGPNKVSGANYPSLNDLKESEEGNSYDDNRTDS